MLLLIFGLILTLGTVQAYDNGNKLAVNIYPGDTVFIGESGLNISAALGLETEIAYFFEGSNVHTDEPEKVVPLTSAEI